MTLTLEGKKPLEYYIGLKYPVTIEAAPEGGYFAKIENLSGCYAQGETIDEAFEMIEVAKQLWMESMYEDEMEIPEPSAPQVFSGKILVRTPKSLHEALNRMANREGVSLNQFLVATLAKAVGANERQKRTSMKGSRVTSAKTKPIISRAEKTSSSGTLRGSARAAKTVIKEAHRSRLHPAAPSRII